MRHFIILLLVCYSQLTRAEYSFDYVTIDDEFPDTFVVSDVLKVEQGYTYFYLHNTREESTRQIKVDCNTHLYQSRYNMKESWDYIGEYVAASDTFIGKAIDHICSNNKG